MMAYQQINKIKQFNFQINRVLTYGDMACDEYAVIEATKNVKTLASWFEAWNSLGEKAVLGSRWLHAAYAYRMAEFFLTKDNPEKQKMYDKARALYYRGFEKLGVKYDVRDIPYKGTQMHTLYLPAPEEKQLILICGGYDSFIEEFVVAVLGLLESGYSLIFYEGDGQGKTLQNGLPFTHSWEEPTKYVLDAYQISNCVLIGISWGGYLALRAAAFEKRIAAVAAYDVFEDGVGVMTNIFPPLLGGVLRKAYAHGNQPLVNNLVGLACKKSILAQWAFTQGMYITQTKTPYEFYQKLSLHRLAPIAERVTQDVLLLAGEKDHYIPKDQYKKTRSELKNTRTLKTRMFTVQEGGEQHCQIGNHQLAIDEIIIWLKIQKITPQIK